MMDKIYYAGFFGDRLHLPAFLAVLAGCAVVAYLLGCLNFGIIISKYKYHEDIRTKGSGNAGSTNMLRTYGRGTAALTFVGDFMKSVVSVCLGLALLGGIGGFTAALFCMLGHAFPCFYGFKGGKGVAVAAAAILCLDWRVFLMLLACFVLLVWWTKYISLGSVTCMFLFPLLFRRMNVLGSTPEAGVIYRMPPIVTIIALLMMILVVWLHRGNLRRIYKGEESQVSFKSKKKEEEPADEGEDDGE